MQLKVGMPAPDFTLPLGTFGTVALSNMRGKPVVLYFYPKDDTPGCTTEACSFRDTLPAFGNHDAAVIGVSKDSVESHAAFAKKYGLNFHLASDAHSNVCETYGVMVQKSNYGKTYTGIERATFLIDTHGIIRAIWRKVSVPGHVEEVLQSVEALRLGLPLPGQEPPPPPPAPVPPKPVAAKPAAKTVPAPKGVAKPVAKVEAQKPAAKKKPVAKAPVKKVVAKKPTVKKVVAKKAVAKKPAAPKKPAQKVVTKKVAAKKPAVKKLVAKKKPAKKKR